MIRYLDEIIACFDRSPTDGIVQSVNNKSINHKLKLINISNYGFINFDDFEI